jgi:aspartyl/asparaginyl beta-hydroxylase (cupin superfamily)
MAGKAVIFNSELDHYADNKGGTDRIILYLDFETKNI